MLAILCCPCAVDVFNFIDIDFHMNHLSIGCISNYELLTHYTNVTHLALVMYVLSWFRLFAENHVTFTNERK